MPLINILLIFTFPEVLTQLYFNAFLYSRTNLFYFMQLAREEEGVNYILQLSS
jgi:hypothetical protein